MTRSHLDDVTEASVKQMLDGATSVYSSLDITFKLVSFEEDFDSALNDDGHESDRGLRALRYPNGVVIFFRKGAGAYSSPWSEHVVMAGVGPNDFAHELGHFLYLGHTHSAHTDELARLNRDEGYEKAKEFAVSLIREAGGLDVFDGDVPDVKDTPPDPGPLLYQIHGISYEECSGTVSLVVDGKTYVLAPDRQNIMSYFKHCPGSYHLSPDQRGIVQRAITSGNRRRLVAGVSPEGPAAVCMSNGDIHVFARGDDRNIWHTFWDGNAWSGWRNDLGAGTLTSGPAAIAYLNTHIHVFARGDDRNIWHTFWDGNTWSGWRNDLASGTFKSGLAALVTPGNAIHGFAVGDDDDRNIWIPSGTGMPGAAGRLTSERAHSSPRGTSWPLVVWGR